ncbi:MAG: TetR/AcrR family transcriptional regulator [Bacteroidales bacterium]|nr:TetR/AcrR family transcriptional regulator [Bacteroidales bacterium]
MKSLEINESAEQRIYDAAVAVFLERGYDGARMQEIADRAGINKSLLHYYYRSKDRLFKKVFADTVGAMFESISGVFQEEIPFEEKLKKICTAYLDFLIQRPQLPLFLLTEIKLHPQLIAETMTDLKLKARFALLKSLVHQSAEKNEIHVQSEVHLMINIISMLIFPVVARNMITMLLDLQPEEYEMLLNERKDRVPEFVLKSIFAS